VDIAQDSPSVKVSHLLAELNMPDDFTPRSKKAAAKQLAPPPPPPMVALSEQLKAYDQEIIKDPVQVRTFVTNKLLEISNCGDTKHELKALELLGKITNVGLFSEHTEVTIKHTSSSELEEAIKDRIKRLLYSDAIDVTPEEIDEEPLAELEEAQDTQESEESEESENTDPV
jgi:hypothetical protein